MLEFLIFLFSILMINIFIVSLLLIKHSKTKAKVTKEKEDLALAYVKFFNKKELEIEELIKEDIAISYNSYFCLYCLSNCKTLKDCSNCGKPWAYPQTKSLQKFVDPLHTKVLLLESFAETLKEKRVTEKHLLSAWKKYKAE